MGDHVFDADLSVSVPMLDEQEKLNARLAGRVCADQIVPYPPGIPVLVPGQVITAEIIQYLVGLLRSQKRVELHGIVYDGYLPCLRVLTLKEEKDLRNLGITCATCPAPSRPRARKALR